MAKTVFHASIEGAQHGAKTLEEFVIFAKNSGATGAEPSNYHVENGNGGFKSAQEIKDVFVLEMIEQNTNLCKRAGNVLFYVLQ